IFYCIVNSTLALNKAKKKKAVVDEDEVNLNVFNEIFIEKMEKSFLTHKSINHIRSRLSKLGKIAFYLRLYRTWIYSPASGHRGFHRYNPYPPVTFHPYIYGNCSNPEGFMSCIDFLFDNIQQRTKFLFPTSFQKADLFIIDFDISAAIFLCFLTKNKISFLAKLPFCSYGFEEHQIHEWPAMAFRQFEDSPELWRFGKNISLDPIDHFTNQIEFECADVSFCPDPCCGRNSTRFFRENDTHNDALNDESFTIYNDSIIRINNTQNIRYGWCAHSSCSLKGKRQIDDEETKGYFEDKKLQAEIEKRKKNKINETEENDEITLILKRETSTHYCCKFILENFN
ncbi:EGF-like domain-containing protein, partial [Meloidogyne graminicola]